MSDFWDDKTPIEEYNVFAGEMAHPADMQDDLRRYHDSYVIDLQPHKDAVHEARIQREARQAERRRERMRERAGEQQGQIIRTIRTEA